jgi:tRNA threonylcarbamoyladenosine modification (KEOPS) complex Cgi121 subunit
MLKHIEEVGKYVEITGFRNVCVNNAEKFVRTTRRQLPQRSCVQFFDAGLVATWQHLYFAVLNALLAFKNERNISKSIAMETILYASAQRQIRKAINFIGVKCDVTDVAMVIIGENAKSVGILLSAVSKLIEKEADDTVLEISERKARSIREAFGITDIEVEALQKNDDNEVLVDLVIEKIALLSTQL